MSQPSPHTISDLPYASEDDPCSQEETANLDEDNAIAGLCYLGMLLLSFLAPLAVFLLARRSPHIRFHAAQALNLAATYLAAGLVLAGMSRLAYELDGGSNFFTAATSLLAVSLLVALALVAPIVGAIAAFTGARPRFPFLIPLVKG